METPPLCRPSFTLVPTGPSFPWPGSLPSARGPYLSTWGRELRTPWRSMRQDEKRQANSQHTHNLDPSPCSLYHRRAWQSLPTCPFLHPCPRGAPSSLPLKGLLCSQPRSMPLSTATLHASPYQGH